VEEAVNNQQLPNNVGWDDGQLWLDQDLASFLRVDVADLDEVVNNARVPCFKLAGLGRRAVPELVREWAIQACGAAARPLVVVAKVPKKRRTRAGSGASRVQP
jgi:hypothetical protein